MRLGPRAFSRDCTEYSDIRLSCEMKDEPAFKPLHGNPTFVRFRESRYPLHVMQQIQGPSHIPIAEGRHLLKCCGNMAYLFNRILGISFFSRQYGVHGAFLKLLCCNWCSYRLETGVSGNLCSCPKEAKAIFLYDGERGIALKPMQGNWSSFQVDLVYTELLHIPVVTSVSF